MITLIDKQPMKIFKNPNEKLDFLYNAMKIDSRINALIYCCYEYGELIPKEGKANTCKKLKELSKKNRENLSALIIKRKRKMIMN
ncbi:MAG: hypothetical protein ABFS35_16595 [Bacteroidota bacterium]